MTYEQIIQKTGKEIELSVTYEYNSEVVTLGHDDIKRAKITFNCELVGSVMSGIELETYQEIPDVPITLTITAKYDEDTATKVYTNYHLKEKATYNADNGTYTHKLYDEVINLMREYQPITINYPTTLLQFFQTMVTELGLTTNIQSLPNGSRIIANDVYRGINYTYRDVLDDIGQATGTLFKVNNTEIQKCTLGATAKVIDDDILKNQNISMGQHFGPINVIVLSRAGGSDNIYYPTTLPENPIEYKISDNILMNDNNRDAYLPELFAALSGIGYDIYDCQLIGYGGFEPLDKITIQTYEGETLKTYNSYVFNNEIVMNGGGYQESIYTGMPEETNTEYQYADTTDKRINQTYLIVDKQNQQITSVVSEVSGQNSKIAQITQDVNDIKMEISNISGMTMTQETENTGAVSFTDISPESNPVLIKIHPTAESFCCLYPNFSLYPTTQNYPGKEGLVPSNSLTPSNSLVPSTGYPAQVVKYPKTRKVIFHNQTENEDIEYELPDDLLYYDSTHYDELIIDAGAETCEVVKKCKFNADGTIGLLAQQQTNSYDYDENKIDLSEGIYSNIYMVGYSSGYMSITLMAKNIYTDQFYTKAETRSQIDLGIKGIALGHYEWYETLDGQVSENSEQITINANGINQRVEKNKVISEINQTSETITINANRVNISGVITAINDNTTTTINGNKITTGSIAANKLDISGTITAINNEQSTTINGNKITTGTIDASKINVTNLSSINSNLGNITGGSLDIGSGNFKVTGAGVVTAKEGTIGGWTLTATTLKNSSGGGTTTLNSNGRLSFSNGTYFFGVGSGSAHPVMSALSTRSVNYWTNLSVSGTTSSSTWIGATGIFGDYLSMLCNAGQSIAIGRASGTGSSASINPSGSLRYSSSTGDWTIRTDSGGIYLRPMQNGELHIWGTYDSSSSSYHSGYSGVRTYYYSGMSTERLYFINGICVGFSRN